MEKMRQLFRGKQTIKQLEPIKGSYFYLYLERDVVETFPKQRSTRLICELNGHHSYSCGLNHFGDGNYFIIVAKKHLNAVKAELGQTVEFAIYEDPNPLGVEVPEELTVLLQEERELKDLYERMTDGKKRSLIHEMNALKGMEEKIQFALKFLPENQPKRRRSSKP